MFERNTVIMAMQALGVNASMLSGAQRRAYFANVLDFDTFDSLSDPVDYFSRAMHIELEHGSAAATVGANITGDEALATARIAWAHLSGVEHGEIPPFEPFPTYYDHLIWMERLHSDAVRLARARARDQMMQVDP